MPLPAPRPRPRRRWRAAAAALLLALPSLSPAVAAEPAPFDLPGPSLRVTVTRGATTLPIGEVPGLAAGDRLSIGADFPEDQRAHFLLLSAFLQGATNPPPRRWIATAETWKRKDKDRLLSLVVPEGARQLVLFLVPDTGGASDAIADAVRGRPGEFVRATQDLNQASLDRSRLDAFMAAIRAQDNSHPEYLRRVAPALARSLAMKLNEECLVKVIELQATCLLENRDSLVLADVHTRSMSEALAGAPADLALQLSSTREAGLGYYSPYIAVVRDIARVFGAFSNPQLDYLPTLSLRRGDGMSLLLNAAPSFDRPKSVLVAAMAGIEADGAPRLRNAAGGAICATRADLVLPVDGAPLIFSTDYARAMAVRVAADGRTVDVPVVARADRGGYVPDRAMPADLKGSIKGRLHGFWGFAPFDGPEFDLQFPTGGAWSVAGGPATLVVGRDNVLTLTGPAPACVENVTMRRGTAPPRPIAWRPAEDGVEVTLPIRDGGPGEVTIEVRQHGAATPATLALRAYAQASRLDGLVLHAGDQAGTLSGRRLDQVVGVALAGKRFRPDGLTRDGDVDRLRIVADGTSGDLRPGPVTAQVALVDGRSLGLPATIAAPRPRIAVLNRSLAPKEPAGAIPLAVEGDALLPDTARLVFSIRAADGTRFEPGDGIEIALAGRNRTARLASGPDLQLQGPEVLVATFDPASLGPAAFGPLRVRLVRGDEASDWQPLATLTRVPRIAALDCGGDPAAGCTLRGQGLFLIDAVAATAAFDASVAVPEGFTGSALAVPRPQGDTLYLRLRDPPGATALLAVVRGAGRD